MSLGVAALAVSAGLLIASVPVARPEPGTAPLALAAPDDDCPFANRLVIADSGPVGSS